MERNRDPHQVVMSREVYDTLLHHAMIGAAEHNDEKEVFGLFRHLRKFNESLREEHQESLIKQAEDFKVLREACLTLLKSSTGKIVYQVSRNRHMTFYTPVTLIGIGRKKTLLDIGEKRHKGCYTRRQSVAPDQLVASLPDGPLFHSPNTGVYMQDV